MLSDPENEHRKAEQVAELAIGALETQRAKTHRLMVVGKITLNGDLWETVGLGPFSSRALKGTREEGGRLAFDPAGGRGQGRFMVVPCFPHARAAWDHFRPELEGKREDPVLEAILADVRRWQPGLWTQEHGTGPTCSCAATRPGRMVRTSAGDLVAVGACTLHPKQEAA